MLEATCKIEKYTQNITTLEEFREEELIIDAVIRNLSILGEAVKMIPEKIKQKYPGIEWKKIAGLRDILIHAYFEVDLDILWDIIKNKIPGLKIELSKIVDE